MDGTKSGYYFWKIHQSELYEEIKVAYDPCNTTNAETTPTQMEHQKYDVMNTFVVFYTAKYINYSTITPLDIKVVIIGAVQIIWYLNVW